MSEASVCDAVHVPCVPKMSTHCNTCTMATVLRSSGMLTSHKLHSLLYVRYGKFIGSKVSILRIYVQVSVHDKVGSLSSYVFSLDYQVSLENTITVSTMCLG